MSVTHHATTCLVTGASSGIGRSFVRLLAQSGIECVALARREEKLKLLQAEIQQAGWVAPRIETADLLSPTGFNRARELVHETDWLINNAGFGMNGLFMNAPKDRLEQMFELDLHVPIQLSREAAQAMRERRTGRIMNVSSIAGMVPTPYHAAYSAGKAALLSFSESLHLELEPSGVHVTALCPGVTGTEFFDAGQYDTKSLVYKLPRQSSDSVARAGLKAWDKNQVVVVPGVLTKVMLLCARIFPRSILAKSAGWTMKTSEVES